MKKITLENAEKLINQTNNQFFSVSFVKTGGTLRHMTCRLGVKKGIKGTGQAFEPKEYELLTVYDLQSKGYRMIRLETLQSVTVDGQTFAVV
jgi:hypothetical protein